MHTQLLLETHNKVLHTSSLRCEGLGVFKWKETSGVETKSDCLKKI